METGANQKAGLANKKDGDDGLVTGRGSPRKKLKEGKAKKPSNNKKIPAQQGGQQRNRNRQQHQEDHDHQRHREENKEDTPTTSGLNSLIF